MNSTQKQIRTRIAPSPTGLFHLGTARTALFNYLFTRKNQGKFILRIEDTDLERSEPEFEKDIINNLHWLGLAWDEGPDPQNNQKDLGQYGPYRQSQRTEIYKKYIKQLLDSDQAFWCYHSKEELEAEKNEQMANGLAPRHICSHYNQPPKNPQEKGIIRLRCPKEKISFNDLIRDRLEFDAELLGDISIARDEKTPLYNLGVVIDDAEMEISHVIRGEDHIPNTPKQIILQEALGFNRPHYAHLPLILGPDKSKLSKRHAAVSLSQYDQEGYLPEAMINFMALLGWHPGYEQDIFNLDNLIKEFSLDRVQKGGAIFNIQRLDWINGHYIRNMDINHLTRLCLPHLLKTDLIEAAEENEQNKASVCTEDKQTEIHFEKYKIKATNELIDFESLSQIVSLEQERMKKLSEIGEMTEFFFKDKLDYDSNLLVWKKSTPEEIKNNLKIIEEKLAELNKFDQKTIEEALLPLTKEYGTGELLWPLRACLSGRKASPGPFEIAATLGKEKTLQRIQDAQTRL